MTVRAYARVSTQAQFDSGLGLEAQHASIDAEADRKGWADIEWYVDGGQSGKTMDRPEMQRLLADLRRGDMLVVAKLDRLSRSLSDFAVLLETAQKRGWNIVALDLGLDLATPTGRLIAGVMASVASWERETIGQRTSDALAAAKRRGTLPGRRSQVPDHVQDRLVALRETMTLQQIADCLNDDGVATVSGGRWTTSSVHSAVRSAELEREARECCRVTS